MTRTKQRKSGRIRGVRASRDKVIQAMANAGVPSQKALACDIAKREGLTNPPTAMVGKVFNEEKVDPLQLARVAVALGVSVQSIYHDQQDTNETSAADDSTMSDIEQEPSKTVEIVSEPATLIASIDSSAPKKRRRSLIISTAALSTLLLSVAVWHFTASRHDGSNPIVSPEALRDFRQAQSFLDSSPNELNLRRAQSHLEAALRKEPTFVAAAAQLCETLVRQSWTHDEEGTLRDARRVCDRARTMDAEAITTRIAYAHLLLRTGQVVESAANLEELLVKEPNNRDALLLASEARIDQFLKTGDRELAVLAERHARLGVEVAPRFWKAHWQKGRAEFELGKLADARRSYKEAARLDPNEYALGNLGSVSFCSGDVQGAQDAYLQARRATGNPRLGEEYMGLFYYYLGAFDRSLESRRSALASYDSEGGPEIHQIWGDLGDSYRRVNQPTQAVDAYTRAIKIVEQDLANGNATAGDKAFRAYYRIAAGQAGAPLPDKDDLRKDLEQAATVSEPGALVRIAIAWRLLSEHDRSHQAAERASAKCPVYRLHPDLRT
jgi:tetratricopeptide (TPR) repeat protein